MSSEKISVLLPINKVHEFFFFAVDSVLEQSYTNFELVILANNCSDSDFLLIRKYVKHPKVKIYRLSLGGLSFALNFGLSVVSSKYIARMDSDDVCHPERLIIQLNFLVNNSLDVVGSDVELIDSSNNFLNYRTYPRGKAISKILPFKNPFAHSSIFGRRDFFLSNSGYNAGYNSEDYDLWLRMSRRGVRWDNVPIPLLKYRLHDGSTQRNTLPYAEVSSHLWREFLLQRKIILLVGFLFSIIKFMVRPRR